MAKKNDQPAFTLGFRHAFEEAPAFRPALNIGSLMDLSTGGYQEGLHGEMISTGGLSHLTGVGGLGNVNKSTLCHHMLLTALDRHMPFCEAMAHDTEYTQSFPRWQALAQSHPRIKDLDLSTADCFMLSSQDNVSGNVFFDLLKKRLLSKAEARKNYTFTTPFRDRRSDGKAMSMLVPSLVEIDSLSALNMDVAQDILNENEVGSGKAQTVFMRAAGAKTQMFMQLPDLAAQNSGFVLYTSAMGREIQLDPYAPTPKKLQYLKNGLAFKHVPGNVTQLSNNLWMITAAVPEQTRDKTVLYPRDASDNAEGDTDLQRVMLMNLRGKGGPSGLPFELIISQKQGLIPFLSEFHYLKTHGRYGLSGNDREYHLDLFPDVTLSRTTIRKLGEDNPLLRRAMTITSEMLQIKLLYPEYKDILVKPKALLEGLKAKKYDWPTLLASRGYWVFEEASKDQPPFLSTLDLLRMNAGLYRPYWLK